ncbi:MAG: DeoR/GlpR transcriptional regulator [Actinobacteria bacterium]|nr:DeoR/GlpR transcriptional regulator [Actinomycetota bacterium]
MPTSHMELRDRHHQILQVLNQQGEVSVVELSRITDVSEMTVRRDLDELEGEGLLKRVHGGAVREVSRSYEPAYALRAGRAVEAKEAIGRRAAETVSEGDALVIDVGTTALAFARMLPDIPLTVVTPDVRVAGALSTKRSIRLILTGGVMRPVEQSLVGPLAEHAFEDLRCDTAFITCGGFEVEAGLTEYNLDDANLKRAMLGSCPRCVVLADSSKVDVVAFARVCPTARVDTLVTDERDEAVLRPFRDQGVEVKSA